MFNLNHKHKSLIALLLLVTWLIGQSSLIAHELVQDHTFDKLCEWQCQTKHQDDVIPVNSYCVALVEFDQIEVLNLNPTSNKPDPHVLPFLRGPPSHTANH